MSEFVAVGPAEALDGPRPVEPEHSLLNTRLRDEDGDLASVVADRDATRILNGVNVWGYPEGCTSLWEPCAGGTFEIKGDESTMRTTRFDSFAVYKPVTCSAIGLSDPSELSDRSAAVLNASLSAGVEKALAAGVAQSTNPFFGDGDVDNLTGATAVSAGVALSMLEEAIGETCRAGMLHMTPAVVAALQAFPIGDAGDTRLVTANGTPVVSGMGYQDVDTPALSTPGATEDWVFATGPVRVYLGPIVTTTVKETLERDINSLTFRAERFVVAVWDKALQAAALVDWAL